MNQILSMKELLTIEEDLEVLNFRFVYDNILMWPFVRNFLLQSAVNKMFDLDYPYFSISKLFHNNIFAYLINTITNNPLLGNNNESIDIMIFGSGVLNVKGDNGKYINKSYDYFAFEYEDRTLIIEESSKGKYLKPRYFTRVRYHDAILIKALIKSQFEKLKTLDTKTVEQFILFLKKKFIYKFDDSTWIRVCHNLKSKAKSLPSLHSCYSMLFEKFNPKLIILDDGSYGHKSHVLKWAREIGIKTAEYQHGAVSKNHQAYNYGKALLGSEYEKYLPQYFLTFGKYWNSQINTPSQTITIGNAYIIEHLKNHRVPMETKTKKIVLLISGGTTPELFRQLALELKKRLDDSKFEILFRPHPAERFLVKERYQILKTNEILLNTGNLYDTLSSVDLIVSTEISTVLFEAMFFRKQVFVQNNPYLSYYVDRNIFSVFNGVEELVEKILNNETKNYNPNDFWDGNWQVNYRNFIENIAKI